MLKCFNIHTYKSPHKYILEITIKQHKSIYLTIPWFFRCQCYSPLFPFQSNINNSFHQYLIVIDKFPIVTQLYLFYTIYYTPPTTSSAPLQSSISSANP